MKNRAVIWCALLENLTDRSDDEVWEFRAKSYGEAQRLAIEKFQKEANSWKFQLSTIWRKYDPR